MKKGAPGSYTFGAIDPSKHIGDITYVDVDPSRGFWGFTVEGYAVGGSSSSLEFSAIADTGTTLLYLPDEIVDGYYSQTDASYDSSQGGYTFACSDTLPDITLNIGGYNAVVPGSFIKYAPIQNSSPSKFVMTTLSFALLIHHLLSLFWRHSIRCSNRILHFWRYLPKVAIRGIRW